MALLMPETPRRPECRRVKSSTASRFIPDLEPGIETTPGIDAAQRVPIASPKGVMPILVSML
jgi:hypothetical protein